MSQQRREQRPVSQAVSDTPWCMPRGWRQWLAVRQWRHIISDMCTSLGRAKDTMTEVPEGEFFASLRAGSRSRCGEGSTAARASTAPGSGGVWPSPLPRPAPAPQNFANMHPYWDPRALWRSLCRAQPSPMVGFCIGSGPVHSPPIPTAINGRGREERDIVMSLEDRWTVRCAPAGADW